jgi:DNA-binding CsgD family transcriptional regulator
VDRTGYDVWAVHRLLPVAAEASLYLRDLDRARHYGARLRASAERFGNRLGLAWADACDALTIWLSGDPGSGAEMMKLAIVELESIPFRIDAARLRRQLAGRLAEMGDRKGALRELANAWSVFDELGAERELERVRVQFQELDSRPPSRRVAGAAGLTGRVLEVGRAMAANLSNKAIANKLGIKVRTVTTHVTNIYRKLGVTDRHAMAEAIRAAETAGDFTRD